VEHLLDIFHEKALNIIFLKVVGAMEIKNAVPKINSLQFIKPGGNSGLREVAFQLGEDVCPDVGYGIQKKDTSLSLRAGEIMILVDYTKNHKKKQHLF